MATPLTIGYVKHDDGSTYPITIEGSFAALRPLGGSGVALQKLVASIVGVRRRVRILSIRAQNSIRAQKPARRRPRKSQPARRTRIIAVAEPSSLRVDLTALSEAGCVDPDQPLDAFVRVFNAPGTDFPSFQNQGVA